MFSAPAYYRTVSLALSEVLDDLAVNQRLVRKTRKTLALCETLLTIDSRLTHEPLNHYYLGSRSEATTISGMKSDFDTLVCDHRANVIQDWNQWTSGVANFLMILDETTPPGYCRLQKLRDDIPLPGTKDYGNHSVKDMRGRILYKNSVINDVSLQVESQRQGPARTVTKNKIRSFDIDSVLALPCKWPESARRWLHHDGTQEWPTAEIRRYAGTTEFFVVPVGSKVSESEQYEWRLSTTLAERCLMCSLNTTQIRCLLKMIVKSCINPNNENCISSYMCKTVLFHCIQMSYRHTSIWEETSILQCLTYCLFILKNCILSGNCPHFIFNRNNLMSGKLSKDLKYLSHERLSNLLASNFAPLLGIQIGDLGLRLRIKLNIPHVVQCNLASRNTNILRREGYLMLNLSVSVRELFLPAYVCEIQNKPSNVKVRNLLQILLSLIKWYRQGNPLEQKVCILMAPQFCTLLGSLMASSYIQHYNTVSPQALAWLSAGLNSDVASSRLKVASIFYCMGDMRRTALILRDTEERYNTEIVEPICTCRQRSHCCIKNRFCIISRNKDDHKISHIAAFCVSFCRDEINCIPRELQYEMFRSTEEDLRHRDRSDIWMDLAVVDSLPYIYFLQYKTYGMLQRFDDQQQALSKLMISYEIEHNLGHRETALNLLGQCMEQENRPADAFRYYMLSRSLLPRNNAANFHICRLLHLMLSQ